MNGLVFPYDLIISKKILNLVASSLNDFLVLMFCTPSKLAWESFWQIHSEVPLFDCCKGGIGILVGEPSFKSEFSTSLVQFSSIFFCLIMGAIFVT